MFRNADYIYAVYRAKSFSRAAEMLYISQSSLSLTIKNAEERIGAQIFNRTTSPITLTEFGKEYISAVEEYRQLLKRVENAISDIEHVNRGHVTIGAANFNATYLLPPALARFREKYPGVTLDLVESTTPELIKKLEDKSIDLICTNITLDEKLFKSYIICHEFMVLVVPRKAIENCTLSESPLPVAELLKLDAETLTSKPLNCQLLRELKDVPFLTLRPGNDTRWRTDRYFMETGTQPPVALELGQASTAYRLSCAGMGATIVSNLMVRKMEPSKSVVYFPITGPDTAQNVRIYIRKEAVITRAMEKFIETAQDAIPNNL